MLVFTLQDRGLLCDFDDRDIETALDVHIHDYAVIHVDIYQ